MANKRITDVDFLDSLNSNESFFVNHNNTIKQVNKSNIVFDINTNLGITATTTELNYCDGLTDNIQTQLNNKAAASHNHLNESLNPAAIELKGSSSHGGYIDFHYGGDTGDYTSRIIESSKGVVTLNDSPIVTVATPNGFYTLSIKPLLPENADFNTYITAGQWSANTWALANTFLNCPYVTAGSFTIYYSDATTNEIHQIWETRDCRKFERYSSNGGSTWSGWKEYMTNILSPDMYGDTLPAAGVKGRIFFKKA